MNSFRPDKHRKVLNDLTLNENTKSYERYDKKPKLFKDHVNTASTSSLLEDKEIEVDHTQIVSELETQLLPYSNEFHMDGPIHQYGENDPQQDDDDDIEGPDYVPEFDDDIDLSELEDIDDEAEDADEDENSNEPDQENIPPPADVGVSQADASFSKHVAMEPLWNKAIFGELEVIMKKYSSKTLDENDEDTYDVTMVAEYSPEIFNYLHQLEYKLVPDPNYMDKQDELKWEMRSVLIDWVVQVHSRFNLLPETLYLTVNYIDRFLSKRKVSLSRFQLVGAVALFIAAKYEEINCPTIQEVAYMADNAYSIDDFLKAERFMIDVLEFDMGWPGPMSFLRRTSKADDYDYETRTLAKYLLEITVMDSRFVASQPSWLAAGAHYLSRKLLNRGGWSELHVFYSGYTEDQLKPLAAVLLRICENAETNHKAIFDKYQERKYRRSSTFVQECLESMRH